MEDVYVIKKQAQIGHTDSVAEFGHGFSGVHFVPSNVDIPFQIFLCSFGVRRLLVVFSLVL